MKNIAIYGCGGFGREVAPLARAALVGAGIRDGTIIFVSDDIGMQGQKLNGIEVMSFDWLSDRKPEFHVALAVGDALVRRKLAGKCEAAGFSFANIFAPTYRQLDGVEIGEGALFCDFTMTTSNLRIGRQFHANIYSYVAHDCEIGDYVTLAPRVCINGNTIVEDDVYVGTGAVIKQGAPDKPLRIGKGAVVGMGAVVTKDVPAGAVVVGNPARIRE